MSSYDSWLERPYQQQQDQAECPDCGGPLLEDKQDRSVECEECGYVDGVDWDSIAEARAEARMERHHESY